MAVGEADSDFSLDGEYVPFLRYRFGSLVMKLGFDPNDSENPFRQKVAEVAKHFEAIITHDAGDEIFDW